MIIVGITGSIGMGKTTVATMLRQMGISVHCSDETVKDLYNDPDITNLIKATFPQSYDRRIKSIDRNKLAALIFDDPEKKEALEEIVHPLVIQSQRDFLREQSRNGKKITALDIPLLFETDAQDRVDYTICVTAPAFIQRKRVLARDNMTEEKFQTILKSQIPDTEKRRLSDFILHNGLRKSDTLKQLKKIISKIKENKNA